MGLTKDLYDPTQEDLGLIPVGLQILSDTFKNNDFALALYDEEYQEQVINIGIDGMIEFISSGVRDKARNVVLEAFVFTLSDIVNHDKFEENLDKEYALQLKQKATETFNQVENYHLQ